MLHLSLTSLPTRCAAVRRGGGARQHRPLPTRTHVSLPVAATPSHKNDQPALATAPDADADLPGHTSSTPMVDVDGTVLVVEEGAAAARAASAAAAAFSALCAELAARGGGPGERYGTSRRDESEHWTA